VYDGLRPDRFIFGGNSLPNTKLYLIYDSDFRHYNVFTNRKTAMAKLYVCNDFYSLYDFTCKCDLACSLCTATPHEPKIRLDIVIYTIALFSVTRAFRII
jgi:hypothetical protein